MYDSLIDLCLKYYLLVDQARLWTRFDVVLNIKDVNLRPYRDYIVRCLNKDKETVTRRVEWDLIRRW